MKKQILCVIFIFTFFTQSQSQNKPQPTRGNKPIIFRISLIIHFFNRAKMEQIASLCSQ